MDKPVPPPRRSTIQNNDKPVVPPRRSVSRGSPCGTKLPVAPRKEIIQPNRPPPSRGATRGRGGVPNRSNEPRKYIPTMVALPNSQPNIKNARKVIS